MKAHLVIRNHRFGFCLIGLLFILAALTQSRANAAPPFDPEIEGMRLMKLVSGTEALRAINTLHGTAIPMKEGFIAHYLGGQGKATVWVSEAPSEPLGKEQIDVMIEKMKQNKRSPFRQYHQTVENNVTVIRFHGMGQIHCVFQIGAWVYWTSAGDKDTEMLLAHLCQP